MSMLSSIRRALARPNPLSAHQLAPSVSRSLHFTVPSRTQVGYGDPTDERAENHTPTPKPSSTPDPHPEGAGKGPGAKTGTTDPEVKVDHGGKGEGNAGGKKGAGESGETSAVGGKRETKRVGEQPKKTEHGGHGPVGG